MRLWLPRSSHRLGPVGVLILATLHGASLARGADQPAGTSAVLTGPAAYGDWTKDAPGVRRAITPADLPPPNAMGSATNQARIVRRPDGAWPKAPPGFAVSALLGDLKVPRQMQVAPNGDIFLAESGLRRIRVIRASAGAEKAESAGIFADQLRHRPYGIAFYPPGPEPRSVYVATEGEVLRYPYRGGDLKAAAAPEIVVPDLPVGGHWTRDIVFSRDGATMFVAVGSGSDVGEGGMGIEARRADILEYKPDGSFIRVFASGIRNPVTLAIHPATGDLWTSVNERDRLGDNLPPDYVTRVAEGGFYGWPWYYIGPHQDPRHPGEHPELRETVLIPDVLLQPHSAPLGLAAYTGRQFPAEYRGDLFVAFHGSWNRAQRTGYKLVRVRLDNGKPTGEYDDFLTGFVTPGGDVWGRPVGVAVAKDGALLMSDDASGTIWRIAYRGVVTN